MRKRCRPRKVGRSRGAGPVSHSWRDRIAKIFSAGEEEAVVADAQQETPADANQAEFAAGERQAEEKVRLRRRGAKKPPVGESQFGSFVIEGGHVEHEELDEEETEMPALAEHFDRYEESEIEEDTIEDGNGSQFGAAVRESGEENALEDAEYDFGSEEFEESELVAEESERRRG